MKEGETMKILQILLLFLVSFAIIPDEKIQCPVVYEQSYILVNGLNAPILKSGEEKILLSYDAI